MTKRASSKIRHSFTLIEMIVAMAVLVILMLLLFRFLASAQDAWSMSKANTRVYENARVAMELIQRELKTAIAYSQPGPRIPFYTGDEDTPTVFVTATNLVNTGAASKLAEVAYFQRDNSLYRRGVDQTNGAAWDFFGAPADWQGNTNPATMSGHEVVRGVEDFSIESFQADGTQYGGGATLLSLPAFVRITLTLFDEQLIDMPQEVIDARKDQTLRTFTKVVFLRMN